MFPAAAASAAVSYSWRNCERSASAMGAPVHSFYPPSLYGVPASVYPYQQPGAFPGPYAAGGGGAGGGAAGTAAAAGSTAGNFYGETVRQPPCLYHVCFVDHVDACDALQLCVLARCPAPVCTSASFLLASGSSAFCGMKTEQPPESTAAAL